MKESWWKHAERLTKGTKFLKRMLIAMKYILNKQVSIGAKKQKKDRKQRQKLVDSILQWDYNKKKSVKYGTKTLKEKCNKWSRIVIQIKQQRQKKTKNNR